MVKKVKYVDVLNRIGSLPGLIICHILSFLPTKDAVRTSILSSRWRYLFASMSTFAFDTYLPQRNLENFKNFVDRLLFFPEHESLKRFRLNGMPWDDNYSYLYGWICAILWRGVKEIDICVNNSPPLPTLLFTCQSLVTLKLNITHEMEVPTKVCLPNLKTLHLKTIEISDGGSFSRLISRCLALEEFVMEAQASPSELNIYNLSLKRLVLNFEEMIFDYPRDFNYVVEINAPNLVDFEYADLIAEGYSNMNSLEDAYIRLQEFNTVATYNLDSERGGTHLLQAIFSV